MSALDWTKDEGLVRVVAILHEGRLRRRPKMREDQVVADDDVRISLHNYRVPTTDLYEPAMWVAAGRRPTIDRGVWFERPSFMATKFRSDVTLFGDVVGWISAERFPLSQKDVEALAARYYTRPYFVERVSDKSIHWAKALIAAAVAEREE